MRPTDMWFRFTNGTDSIYGRREHVDLILTVKTRGILLDIRLDRDSIDRLRDWLNRAFPSPRRAEVIELARLPQTLSISDDSGDPEADS